jgi:hypothetical protein
MRKTLKAFNSKNIKARKSNSRKRRKRNKEYIIKGFN